MVEDGYRLRMLIDRVYRSVQKQGKPVIVDGKQTMELMNKSFTISYNKKIDIENIDRYMGKYYKKKGLDLTELQELEKEEYRTIYNEFVGYKFNYFKDDIHSRRVLWSDDCCISFIQYLIRDNTIHCFLHLRSSDVVYKLFSDLNLIHRITASLQNELGLYNANINICGSSFHVIQ